MTYSRKKTNLKKKFLSFIVITGITMKLALATDESPLYKDTHTAFDCTSHRAKLEAKAKTELTLPLDMEIDLLHQLSEFDAGRFLLINKGLNGYWTAYMIIHGPRKANLSDLESWLLHKAPAVKATQERYGNFIEEVQKRLNDGIKMASIPCGLMDDLLSLDYTTARAELTGIDLDNESLILAQENAQKYGIKNVKYIKRDAWDLKIAEEYDIITSNGLNIYEPNYEKVIDLYKEFYKALKTGGILITSFLTPSPMSSSESTWKNYNPEDAIKQKAIFSDIIQAGWQTPRTEAETRQHLEAAGFTVIDVIYDSQGMFPTIVAQK